MIVSGKRMTAFLFIAGFIFSSLSAGCAQGPDKSRALQFDTSASGVLFVSEAVLALLLIFLCVLIIRNIRLKETVKNRIAVSEYELMKYTLTSDALGIGLWDMSVKADDPVNSENKIVWSPELRLMLGFEDENDFPNELKSWRDRLHPDDEDRVMSALIAHITDRSGKTPFDLEYRLMLKNGSYRVFRAFGATQRSDKGVPLRVAG
ncbi:MAG: PAS domain-containing protein, partial [Oscillospiraceae bacterium]|nr:PAS domain-containing protein [Oscillospiraceae bacterium]